MGSTHTSCLGHKNTKYLFSSDLRESSLDYVTWYYDTIMKHKIHLQILQPVQSKP
jgi:hypothetical protein